MPKSSTRRDEQRVRDIVDACDAIAEFVRDHDLDSFSRDDLVRSAVLYKLMLIGECAARLSAEFTSQHPGVPWKDIAGMRNIVVHEYFAVSWPIVWTTATKVVPHLREAIQMALGTDGSSSGSEPSPRR